MATPSGSEIPKQDSINEENRRQLAELQTWLNSDAAQFSQVAEGVSVCRGKEILEKVQKLLSSFKFTEKPQQIILYRLSGQTQLEINEPSRLITLLVFEEQGQLKIGRSLLHEQCTYITSKANVEGRGDLLLVKHADTRAPAIDKAEAKAKGESEDGGNLKTEGEGEGDLNVKGENDLLLVKRT